MSGPFGYQARRDGTVLVTHRGKTARTLTGSVAERFLDAASAADEQEQQLLMARATGNFKRGNEKGR